LSSAELGDLLRPWLGAASNVAALPLPAVVEVHLAPDPNEPALAAALTAVAPGTLAESHGVWVGRLSVLALSLQACAWLALAVVVAVAAAVVMVATRAGLASRRDAIEIVHGLGATDGAIAGHFARRITRLAALGGLVGAIAALPVLFVLTDLAAPFMTGGSAAGPFAAMSAREPIWALLALLPVAAGLIGFVTAQATVRRWLRTLP
jgi:cell division transport system permease protein